MTGNLSPMEGFKHGFCRWTFGSQVKDRNTWLTKYKRFDPEQGELVQTREVTSELLFEREDAGARSFQPEITENSLTVLDYSQRQMLFQFYKQGLFDQNHNYELTNHLWNFDYYSNIVATDFALQDRRQDR